MSVAPTQLPLVEDALALLPALIHQLQASLHDELTQQRQHPPRLVDGWMRQRLHFASNYEQVLSTMLSAAMQGEDPLHKPKPLTLDALSLVDEQQALQDVAIAHVANAIEDNNRSELHQLNNYFAALRGTARARKSDNPLRAEIFASGLFQALQPSGLEGEDRYALMRIIATPLAKTLGRLYGSLCAQLRAAELTPLVASHAANRPIDVLRLNRAREHSDSVLPSHQPASLDSVARRVEAHNSRPQGLDASGAPLLGPGSSGGGSGKDMLSRLYDQILADPRLLPPIKALLARLQVAVTRLAMTDLSLLRRQDHPTWRLLNRVAGHGMGFERADDARLQEFLRFMSDRVERLVSQPQPTAANFEMVYAEVDGFISEQARQRSERSSAVLAALEREQMRGPWLQVLREQVKAQLAEAGPGVQLSKTLRDFLKTRWVEVIVQAMVQDGRDAPVAHAHIDWVDQLLASLQPPASPAERERLRASLPALIAQLQRGCDSIALPADKRAPVLDELMQTHGRLLRGQTPSPAPVAPQYVPPPSPEDKLQQLLSERESQLPSHWAHAHVDRGELPTVPVTLYSGSDAARVALDAWVERLQVGAWYHLFVQSDWITAQVAWISESRQFFLFVGQDTDERHSLTRGALEQLLANGLIAPLDDEQSLVQQALNTLMQDLGGPE